MSAFWCVPDRVCSVERKLHNYTFMACFRKMLVVCVIDRNLGGLEDSDEEGVKARTLAYKEVERACER